MFNIMHNLRTDDIQLYIPIDPKGSQSFDEHVQCLSKITSSLASNFLHLNSKKTECGVFGPSSATFIVISVLDHVENLGLTFF